MIKVTDVVLDLIKTDELALESLRAGILNLSAYAQKIQPKVENITFKEVKKGTIVVALSRILKNKISFASPLKPEVQIDNLSVKSSLSYLTFKKTADVQRKIAVLHPFQISTDDLFAVTEGPTEVALICSEAGAEKLVKHLSAKPITRIDNLIAVTAKYSKKYIDIPNFYYVLLDSLASKRINLIEIVSTLSEITFIVKKEDMEETIKMLNLFFTKKGEKNEK